LQLANDAHMLDGATRHRHDDAGHVLVPQLAGGVDREILAIGDAACCGLSHPNEPSMIERCSPKRWSLEPVPSSRLVAGGFRPRWRAAPAELGRRAVAAGDQSAKALTRSSAPLNWFWSPGKMPESENCQMVWKLQLAGRVPTVEA